MISAQTCFAFGAGESRCTLFRICSGFPGAWSFHLHGICRASPCGTGLSAALKPRPLAGFSPSRASIPDAKAGVDLRTWHRHAAPATDITLPQQTLRVRGLAGSTATGWSCERGLQRLSKDPRCPDILARAPLRTGPHFMTKSPTRMAGTRMRGAGVRHHSVNMSPRSTAPSETQQAPRRRAGHRSPPK